MSECVSSDGSNLSLLNILQESGAPQQVTLTTASFANGIIPSAGRDAVRMSFWSLVPACDIACSIVTLWATEAMFELCVLLLLVCVWGGGGGGLFILEGKMHIV